MTLATNHSDLTRERRMKKMRRKTRRKRMTTRTKTMMMKRTLTWEEVLALATAVATPMRAAEMSSMTMPKS